MRKSSTILMILALIIAVAGFCFLIPSSPAKKKIKELKIGISVYNLDDTFIASIIKEIELNVIKREKMTGYKITLSIVDGRGSQTGQNDQVDKFINQKYDVLCINLVDRTAASTIIEKAKNAEIPLVLFNREPVQADMYLWDRVFYVGSMPQEAGIMQGNMILNQYEKDPGSIDKNQDGMIQYVILEGEQGHQDALIRTEYCLKPLIENDIPLERLANANANWQTSLAEEQMNNWLKKYGDKIEVIFSNNDEMALGAISAIEKANMDTDIKIVGVDGVEQALQAIKDHKMLGTVINDAKSQAAGIVDIAFSQAIGQNMEDITGLQKDRCIRTKHRMVVDGTLSGR